MTLADTDVLIDFLAGREPAAERVTRELESGNLWTTVLTRFEMLSGARRTRETQIIGKLLDSIKIVPLEVAAADRAPTFAEFLNGRASGLEWRIA